MAGDWIKIRVDLTDDPDVFLLSELLDIDCPTTVGHLVMFWGWMDRHTADGIGIKLTDTVIDKKIGLSGFAAALREIGWLSGPNMALELPSFERHNGTSAKARALESEAKRLRRLDKSVSEPKPETPVRQLSDNSPPKCPTREEKRREEKNNSQTLKPSVLTDDHADKKSSVPDKPQAPELVTKAGRKLTGKRLMAFELFWTSFDYKKDRAAAADAWLKIDLTDELFDHIIQGAQNCARNRPHEIAAGKTPIYPQGWLTGRRWEDEDYVAPHGALTIDHKGYRGGSASDAFQRMTDRSWAEGLS